MLHGIFGLLALGRQIYSIAKIASNGDQFSAKQLGTGLFETLVFMVRIARIGSSAQKGWALKMSRGKENSWKL